MSATVTSLVPSSSAHVNEFMRDMKVDQACLTPAVAQILVVKPSPKLRTLSLGGEPLQLTDIRQ